jgi:hypothetical protein
MTIVGFLANRRTDTGNCIVGLYEYNTQERLGVVWLSD